MSKGNFFVVAIGTWLSRMDLNKRLEWDPLGKHVLGVAPIVKSMFGQVGFQLKEKMQNQVYHGELYKGNIEISGGQVFTLLNFNPKATIAFEIGLKKDIEDFKGLAMMIPSVSYVPTCLKLLIELCDQAQRQGGKQLMDSAYFIYRNSAFFNDQAKIVFYFKVLDFIGSNFHHGRTLMHFQGALVDCTGWEIGLPSPLTQVYLRGPMSYIPTYGIFWFHRNVLLHLGQYIGGCRMIEAQRTLSLALPDFSPKFFYLVATILRKEEHKFGPESLVEHLQEEAEGFP